MRLLVILPISLLVLFGTTASFAEVPQCDSFTFSVTRGGVTHLLDVRTLRRDRPELYELFRDDSIRGLYFDEATKEIAKIHRALATAGAPSFPNKDEYQRFIEFMYRDVDRFFEELLGACGSLDDNMAGELSLMFSKAEGDELVKNFRNPIVARFLKFASRRQRVPTAKEISESFFGPVFRNAVARLADRCRVENFDTDICARLERLTAPSALR